MESKIHQIWQGTSLRCWEHIVRRKQSPIRSLGRVKMQRNKTVPDSTHRTEILIKGVLDIQLSWFQLGLKDNISRYIHTKFEVNPRSVAFWSLTQSSGSKLSNPAVRKSGWVAG
jgi:hypothetical protein